MKKVRWVELQLPLGDVPVVVVAPPEPEKKVEVGQSFEDVPLFAHDG